MNKRHRHIEIDDRHTHLDIERAYGYFIRFTKYIITLSWSEYTLLKKIRLTHGFKHYIVFLPIKK